MLPLNRMHVIYQHRRSGKSTMLAMMTLGEAMYEPHVWHQITDHHKTYEANRMLGAMIQGIVKRLELEGFVFQQKGETLSVMFIGKPDV